MTCILVPCAGMQLCNDRMPSGHGSQLGCLCRWDGCWIRLLDGMLQLSVAGTRDYELRVPTRIRSIVINNAAGTADGQISVGGSSSVLPSALPMHHVPLRPIIWCRDSPAP